MNRREILKGLTILPLAGAVGTGLADQRPPENPSEEANSEEWFPKKELIKTDAGTCIRSGHFHVKCAKSTNDGSRPK